ncbi:helix-turn-helix domain-containing protein [Haladaptatus caseinilyticus]|uniref:helix-turn-helix domain-containing protein n=1 Tax=Haladaptatus caseinilyticus TaxID=2993314 RepID=UPI00224A7EF3|nr:helix-turn-helix domain-containing protein [Haladaptatus caseinilyticus]
MAVSIDRPVVVLLAALLCLPSMALAIPGGGTSGAALDSTNTMSAESATTISATGSAETIPSTTVAATSAKTTTPTPVTTTAESNSGMVGDATNTVSDTPSTGVDTTTDTPEDSTDDVTEPVSDPTDGTNQITDSGDGVTDIGSNSTDGTANNGGPSVPNTTETTEASIGNPIGNTGESVEDATTTSGAVDSPDPEAGQTTAMARTDDDRTGAVEQPSPEGGVTTPKNVPKSAPSTGQRDSAGAETVSKSRDDHTDETADTGIQRQGRTKSGMDGATNAAETAKERVAESGNEAVTAETVGQQPASANQRETGDARADGKRTESDSESLGATDETADAGGELDSADGTPSKTNARQRYPSEESIPKPVEAAGLAGAALVMGVASHLPDVTALTINSGAASVAPVSTGKGTPRLWRFMTMYRYSRYDDSDPLEHEVRQDLFARIERTPGLYLSELDERMSVSLSTIRHHLRVLEREKMITGAKLRGKRRFYPDDEGVELAAALADGPTAAVLDAVARREPASGGELADELGRDPSTVTHHLKRLEADGLIERERDGRAIVNRLSSETRNAFANRPTASADD